MGEPRFRSVIPTSRTPQRSEGAGPTARRPDSWKETSAYLLRRIRAVQRCERKQGSDGSPGYLQSPASG